MLEQNELEFFQQLFNDIKKHHSQSCHELASELTTSLKGDEMDIINDEKQRALALKLAGREQFFMRKVDAALMRIKNGTFGECVECGDDIDLERLKARPIATQCITCKEGQERQEAHVLYEKKSRTHGKGIINDNIIPFPPKEDHERSIDEKILKFNQKKLNEENMRLP